MPQSSARKESSVMSRSLIYNTVFASLVFAASASTAVAQDEIPTKVTDQNRSGDLPFSTTVGTGVEHVVVSSGNLTVNIPIAHVPGRGMDFNYVLRYDGRYLVVSTACFTGGCSQLWKIEKNNSYLPTNGIWQTNNTYLTNVSDNGPCYLDTDTGGPAPGGYTG